MSTARAALVAFGAAALLLAGFEAAARLRPGPARQDTEALHRAVRAGFLERLHEAEGTARCVLETGLVDAASRCVAKGWRDRFEGAAVGRPPNEWVDWTGTPTGPLPAGRGAVPSWSLRSLGMRHTLVVRSAPSTDGTFGAAWFTLDAAPDTDPSSIRLPAAFLDAGRGTLTLLRASSPDGGFPLDAPDGSALASLALDPATAGSPAERIRALGRALAGLLAAFGLAAASIGAWRRPAPWLGILLVAGARAALVLGWTLETFLPRGLGGPSLYGAARGWGILASPAALAATAAAWLAVAFGLGARRPPSAASRSRRERLLASALAAASLPALAFLAASLARDGRGDVLSLADAASSAAHSLLLVGFAAAALATALVLRAFWAAWFGRERGALVLGIAIGLSAGIAAGVHGVASERLAAERLRAEFAPLVADASARRRLALESHVAEIARSPVVLGLLTGGAEEIDPSAGWLLWSRGPLGLRGWLSSIDVFDAGGTLRAHFAFGLPPLQEPFPPGDAGTSGTPRLREEVIAFGASDQRLLHAEVPVAGPGTLPGRVVAHVLDEPDNLPFLPGVAPYLSALGSPASTVEGPEHVLYAPEGRVLSSTVPRPPPVDPSWFAPDGTGRLVPIRAGGTPYLALAVRDGPWIHLLLSNAGGPLDWAGALARVALLQGVLLALGGGARALLARLAGRSERWGRGVTRIVGTGGSEQAAEVGVASADSLPAPIGVAGSRLRGTRVARELPDPPRRRPRAGHESSPPFAPPWGGRTGSFYRKLLAAMLAASFFPLLGLTFVLRASIAQGAERSLQESAADVVGAVRRVVEDYAAVLREEESPSPPRVDDGVLSWLRTLVGQEIHLYQDGLLAATSKPELFESGLLSSRLPGEVRRALFERGEPSVVRDEPFGGASLPVAYARADLVGRTTVLAVPLVLERRAIGIAMERVLESLFLATLLLGTLLALASAWMASTVARPVREMVDATARIARGDYAARLEARGGDELATLAEGFNAMATALGAQRADLERRRDYIEALLRHATTGVVSTDAVGRIVTMNPAATALLVAAGARVAPGLSLREAAEDAASLGSLAALLARPLGDRVEPEEIDVRIPDSPRRLRVVRIPLPDPDGGPPGSLVLLDDVTELARSNQLAAWAEMARAIAHEIKNPLTPIQLSTEHMERLLRDRGALPDGDLEACLRTVLGQVRALREIALEFSAYAKIPDLAPVPTDVPEFLREAVAPYRAALPPGIRLEERYDTVPACAIDARAMGRAIANLIENALHAMPRGGTLRVSTTHDEGSGEVTITVEDTGEGLTPEALRRLFEPYFSTKTSGTGLGLAIVLRTVEAHGGRIDVSSRPGNGAAFRLRLPAIR
jgi:signal transduction histidine kinase/HAMP domain-containing protein